MASKQHSAVDSNKIQPENHLETKTSPADTTFFNKLLAHDEGISLNHFICLAVEVKINDPEQSIHLTPKP